MTVTGISDMSGKRYRIFIDDEFVFALYRGELRIFGIAEGREISDETYNEIMRTVLPKRAKLRSLNLLKSKDYTERQLREKLKQGYYPEVVIDEAIAYLASFSYINDDNYALKYMEYHLKDKSRRRIESDLYAKGISSATVEQAYRRLTENGTRTDETEMARQLLEKKHYDPDTADNKEKQRLYGFLMRKGFSGETIRKAMSVPDKCRD